MELEVLQKAWLNYYLTNKSIFNDHSSDIRLITGGVGLLQGSVLGPVLFLLYINEIIIMQCVNQLKFVLFTDDTNISCSSISLPDLQDHINRELAKLCVL